MRVLRQVQTGWDKAVHGMAQMNQSSLIRPQTAYNIFRLDKNAPDQVVKVDVGPIVFYVPERPNHRGPDLFIVVKGWLTFEGPDFRTLPLKTKDFGTEVAYFRSKASGLEHVYGAHYDMDEVRAGHPVFHAQIGAQMEFGANVQELFGLDTQVTNKMESILGTVRTPSAQMDVFSVITQICADHLMGEAAPDEVSGAFKGLRKASEFLIGAAHRLAYLNSAPAIDCYRSTHWYESPAANA